MGPRLRRPETRPRLSALGADGVTRGKSQHRSIAVIRRKLHAFVPRIPVEPCCFLPRLGAGFFVPVFLPAESERDATPKAWAQFSAYFLEDPLCLTATAVFLVIGGSQRPQRIRESTNGNPSAFVALFVGWGHLRSASQRRRRVVHLSPGRASGELSIRELILS